LQGDSFSLLIVKTQRKQQRSINSIATRRWTAYMAAAAASTLAGTGSAEAEIHYSGNVSIELTPKDQATLPLSNGAALVFQGMFGSAFSQTCSMLLEGVVSGSARGFELGVGYIWLSNLPQISNVSMGTFFSIIEPPNRGILFSTSYGGNFSPTFGANRGFVGFRFDTGNGTQYGWVRIHTKLDGKHHAHTLIKDYAWGDVGDAIVTGQKHSLQAANANSFADSLGLLAFGAQGLDVWRAPRLPKSN
jgi:hypothetical protein